jgi:hypothetical protein
LPLTLTFDFDFDLMLILISDFDFDLRGCPDPNGFAAVVYAALRMWDGHSCPSLLTLAVDPEAAVLAKAPK